MKVLVKKMKKIKQIIINNKDIFKNIFASFLIKGGSLILALLTTPAYMKYFKNDTILGVWFTILSVLNWVMMFDLGIGNGLRNKLPKELEENNKKNIKEYISSSYIAIFAFAIILAVIFIIVQNFINWNQIFNVNSNIISNKILGISMIIVTLGILLRLVLNLSTSIFYALQKSAINNFLTLMSTLLIFIYISIAKVGTPTNNLIKLSVANAILSNLPLLIATIYLFKKPLNGLAPRLKSFKFDKAKEVLKIGIILLWLQLIAMIVFSTHSILITNIINPEAVVEYNIYYKIFNTIASLFALALVPIWSAVTKAEVEKNYIWIIKLYKVLLVTCFIILILNFIAIPFLQLVFNIWLKENTITVNIKISIIMAIFNFWFLLHNVNTSICNGLSYFKIQNIWMTVGAVLMIPCSIYFCHILGDWSGVILGSTLSIIPYETLQPIYAFKYLKNMNNNIK